MDDNFRRIVVLFGVLGLTSCASARFTDLKSPFPVATSKSTAEVGQVDLDIVAINQWQDVASRFQSNYGLTGPTALLLVNKAASYENLSAAAANSVSLGISANGTVLSRDTSHSDQTSNVNGVTSSSTTTTTTRDAKQAAPDSAPAANATAPSAQTAAALSNLNPGLAPILGYQAADSLFKYAAVLDAGFGQVAACGYVPVLVTFQIQVIPNKRNQPYDTYVDLSILPSTIDGADKVISLVSESTMASTSSQQGPGKGLLSRSPGSQFVEANVTDSDQTVAMGEANPENCSKPIRNDDIDMVSFSTDSLENTQSDVSQQQTKALALAAALRAGVVAGSASFQNLSTALDHSLALRPNSLISVGRAGKNMLHIRLGANRFGENDYEILPLPHDVSVVMLVPYQTLSKKFTAIGHYYFKDARGDGTKELPERETDGDWQTWRTDYLQRVAGTAKMESEHAANIKMLNDCDQKRACNELQNLAESLPDSTFDDFFQNLFKPQKAEPHYGWQSNLAINLWQRLSRVSVRPGITSVTSVFPLTMRVCPPIEATVLVKDDGTNAIATVEGADYFSNTHIMGELMLTEIGRKGTTGATRTLAAGFDVGGPDIGDLKFPSFSTFFKPGAQVTGQLRFQTRDHLFCPDPNHSDNFVGYPVSYERDAKKSQKAKGTTPSAPPGLSAYPMAVVETTGNGTVTFSVDLTALKADTAKVTASGAGTLVSIGAATPKSGAISLTTSGDYSATFSNLAPGKTISLAFEFNRNAKSLGTEKISFAIAKP